MTEITKKKYPINPTLKLVDEQGRATSQFQRLLRAISELVEAVTIEDGEISADKLAAASVIAGKIAAEAIHVSTLFADEVVITSKVAQNAISEITALTQVGSHGPNGQTLISGAVPVGGTGNTGLLLTFTSFMSLPQIGSSNFGDWGLHLQRNGVTIGSTPPMFYDDNFTYPPVASFIDNAPGTNPTYSIVSYLNSGPGLFDISGGVLNVGLLKR